MMNVTVTLKPISSVLFAFLVALQISHSYAQELDLDPEFEALLQIQYAPIQGTPFVAKTDGEWRLVLTSDPERHVLGALWKMRGDHVQVFQGKQLITSYALEAERKANSLRIGLLETTGKHRFLFHGALLRVGQYLILVYSKRGGPLFIRNDDELVSLVFVRNE